MGRLKVFGSSSSGNCYLLEAGHDLLMIEAGVPFREVLGEIGYEKGLSRLRGCIVTHRHGDHSKYIHQVLAMNKSVWSCKDVAESHKGVIPLMFDVKVKIGGFTVQPIPVSHSVECYAYLIEHDEIGRCLFITDCSTFPYRLRNIHHIWCEANWCEDCIVDGLVDGSYRFSISKEHLSLDMAEAVIRNNLSTSTQDIVLLHLSDKNSDTEMFKSRIANNLSFDAVYVADKGFELELDKEEF